MRGHPAVMTKWLLILSFVLLIDPSFLNVKSEKSISSRMRSKVSQPIILASKLVLLSQITQIAKLPIPANAVEIDDIDILKARIINKDYSMFRPGKQNGDIFYPPWFGGVWNTTSRSESVEAPLGVTAFGGERVYNASLQDLNTELEYLSRFKTLQNGFVLNDRLFNVEQIAEASIGKRSVIDDTQTSTDLASEIHLVISPKEAKGILYDVNLFCTDRLQRQRSLNTFDTLERTAQTLGIRQQDAPPPFRKQIETITLYTLEENDTITALQRTSTFLSPLDPRYNTLITSIPAIENTPLDVRTYKLIFTRYQ